MTKSLSEIARALLRTMLASGAAPQNIRKLLDSDNTYMSCPRCGISGPVDIKLCQEFRCDQCGYIKSKKT